MTDNIDLLTEGEERDCTNGSLHSRALSMADTNGHKVRRTITLGQDELLHLDNHGDLSVAGHEYLVVQSAGDYHCSCGEMLDGPKDARDHLIEVKES